MKRILNAVQLKSLLSLLLVGVLLLPILAGCSSKEPTLEDEVNSLSQQVTVLKGANSAALAEIDALLSRVAELEARVAELQSSNTVLTEQLAELRDELIALRIDELQRRIAQLEALIAQLETDNDELQAQIDELRREIDGMKEPPVTPPTLEEYKELAKAELDAHGEAKIPEEYRFEHDGKDHWYWAQVQAFVANAKEQIDRAKDEANVVSILGELKEIIDNAPNGSLYSVQFAYDNGLVTLEDLENIAIFWQSCFVIFPNEPNVIPPPGFDGSRFTEEIREKIHVISAYIHARPPLTPTPLGTFKFSIKGYYGHYNNSVAVAVEYHTYVGLPPQPIIEGIRLPQFLQIFIEYR